MLAVAAGLTDTPQTYSGALNDKVVFTSGGHGWQWSDVLGRYATDRGDNNELVEDFGNQEQMSFFADYALRAGATVVPMRPVGRQINERVVDNQLFETPNAAVGTVTFTGTWSNSSSTKYYAADYNADSVPYKFASTVTGAETATATYTPNIPQAGFYPVYTWVLYGTDRTEQTYRINHTGGTTEVTVNHGIVGSGWVYLGTYHFNAGSSATGEGSVVISNKAPVSGKVVIADAIRFGNGMGDWVDTPTGAPGISGYPREDENSFHWIARSVGVGTTLATATGASSDNNVSAPSNFAQYMYHGVVGGAVYVGFHSNAGGGRGARGLIDSSSPTPHQAGTNGLADILGDQINQDMQNLNGVFEYNWTTGTTSTFTGAFGEINLGSAAEMDATIIEVAFHDSVEDAAIMRDPNGRDQIARSTAQGVVQYFSLYGSPLGSNTNLPSAPTTVRAVSNASGQVTLNWAAGPSSPASVYGAAATGYKIYASVDGYGFDGGTAVGNVTTTTISGYDPNTIYYFKVAATNAGGESSASEVIAALPSGGAKQVLIVNGFDRYDRTQNFRYDFLGQQVDRVWPRWNNSFDYINRVASAVQAAKPGTHVASTSNEAIISGAVNLTDYKMVIWILGNESTADDTFNATEQTKVTQFLAAGGNLFLSGAEIGWDLDQQNNGRTFFESTLKGNYVSDDAAVYTANVVASPGIFSGLSSFAFSSGASSTVYSTRDDQVYDVTTPDMISAQAGAANALTYSTNAAAIQAGSGGIGTGSLVMFGFPFETMTSATRRQQAMGRVLEFLGTGVTIETRVNGQDADSVTGPIVAAGGNVSLTYIVSNTGIIGLSGVTIVDDNGTSGTAGDDFSPTLTSGDTNSNNILDVGETWTYSATRTAAQGQRTHSGKATVVTGAKTFINTDPGNYFGSAPAIDIKTRVNGLDADSPTGPVLAVGGNANFTYVLTNIGNVALNNVVVVDDNGTPGNTADDFNPTFSGGDTNSNNLLDLGETWTYTSTRSVVAGQFSNVGTASGADSLSQSVSDTDPGNFFGSAPGINIETFVDGQDADLPTGPNLLAGSTNFTYVVTNTGNIALGTVVVVDDNGTPGNTADDFNPAFSGGDTNSNNLLDLGETWTYSATRSVMAGQFSNTATASGKDSINQVVNDTDPTNYFGLVPGIQIETFVNGQDADSPTGPVLAVGGNANFSYVLTNTGSTALGTVVVVDDNGTPGNTADDFNPTFDGGDTNSNNVLDLGETWTYSSTRSVVAGQFSNVATANGTDSLIQSASDTDAGNFFGSAPGISIETFVSGQDADSPAGPTVAYGTNAALTYSVTNAGNIALSNVVVVDDNGTPGNTADDFNPAFSGGDTNSNNLLDLGETWSYTAAPAIVIGQYTGSAGVSAQDSLSQVVNDIDPTNYFGSAPGIHIETFVDGQDADSPTGPTLLAGNTTFTYVVTNTGNVALNTVVVVDNNSTPGTSDDFNPTFSGGDTNSNNLLDLGETWTYSATRTVAPFQRNNIGTASGKDSINQLVSDTDPTNYFGAIAGIAIQTTVQGLDADSPTGPVIAVGDNAVFMYFVTRTGSTALGSVIVIDDNGTPGNTADDFSPTYTSGDFNNNNLLDADETWHYSATRVVVAGQFSNIATASGTDSFSQSASDTDPTNFFGSAPGIDIETFVNGQDADAPTGPSTAYGGNVTLNYSLTNTGNIALKTVVVVDDNGTPGNTGDDFSPLFTGGDTNSNSFLDLGETWTYAESRAAIVGQYSASASVSAKDSINQTVSSFDATNYIGLASADFDDSHEVDASDFVLWRKNDGLIGVATHSQGDADGDHNVATSDYDTWRSQFGNTSPGGGNGGAEAGSRESTSLSNFATSAEPSESRAALSSAFGALGASQDKPQILDRSLAKLRRSLVPQFQRDEWISLLEDLAERRSQSKAGESASQSDDNQSRCDDQGPRAESLEKLGSLQKHARPTPVLG